MLYLSHKTCVPKKMHWRGVISSSLMFPTSITWFVFSHLFDFCDFHTQVCNDSVSITCRFIHRLSHRWATVTQLIKVKKNKNTNRTSTGCASTYPPCFPLQDLSRRKTNREFVFSGGKWFSLGYEKFQRSGFFYPIIPLALLFLLKFLKSSLQKAWGNFFVPSVLNGIHSFGSKCSFLWLLGNAGWLKMGNCRIKPQDK